MLLLCGALATVASTVQETDENRPLTREETVAGIRALWSEFNQLGSFSRTAQVGAIYARYSTKYQSSILDQVRSCLKYAAQNGLFVPLENIHFDIGVSGRKRNRPGLRQLEICLEGNRVQALIVFATNRLFRRSSHAHEFVNSLVQERMKRIVFVASGIDSEKDEQWSRYLRFLMLFDEFAAEMYVQHIRSAHMGQLRNREVHGTLTFGYHGVKIAGTPKRNGKFSRRIEIHPDHSALVKRVFEWFVNQRKSIVAIVRELNSIANVPLPPMNTTGRWTRLAVSRLLANERYRGEWHYGKTESVLLSSKDYTRQRERNQPLATEWFEELRIVSDELFYAAQRRLAEFDASSDRGRKPEGETSDRLPKLLNGIFYCPTHDQRLHVGGPHGEYMICPKCHRESDEQRVLFSQLNRQVALQKICTTLADRIRDDSALVDQIIGCCQRRAESLQRPDPARIEDLKRKKQRLKSTLQVLLRQNLESEAEAEEFESALREKRSQLMSIESELALIENAANIEVRIPTANEVRERLSGLADVLGRVVTAGTSDEVDDGRELLRRLTGGRIELTQQGERRAQKGWLRGTFRAPLVATISEMLAGVEVRGEEAGIEIVIDFDRPRSDMERVAKAWELYCSGKLQNEIATILKCSRSNVTRLLRVASAQHNVPFADGRKRRATLEVKQTETPQYQTIADQAAKLWNRRASYCEIGRQLKCSDVTAEKAIRYWHQSFGLPVPTATTRREQLRVLAQKMRAEGASTPEISKTLGVSTTTVRNWLSQ